MVLEILLDLLLHNPDGIRFATPFERDLILRGFCEPATETPRANLCGRVRNQDAPYE